MAASWISSLDRGCLVLVPAEKAGGTTGEWTPAIVRGRSGAWLQFCSDALSKPGSSKRFSMAVKDIALKTMSESEKQAFADSLTKLAAIEGITLQEPLADAADRNSSDIPGASGEVNAAPAVACRQDQVEVCLTMLSGCSTAVTVPRDVSVADLQNIVASSMQIPVAEQRLVFEVECLENIAAQPFLQSDATTVTLLVLKRPPAKEVVLAISENAETWQEHLEEASGAHIRLVIQGERMRWERALSTNDVFGRIVDVLTSHRHALLGFTMRRVGYMELEQVWTLIEALPNELKELDLAGMLDGRGLCAIASGFPGKLESLNISNCRCQCCDRSHEIKRDVGLAVPECPACQSVDSLLNLMNQHPSLELVIAHNTFSSTQRNFIRSKQSKSAIAKLVF